MKTNSSLLAADAAYLIIGGTGGLGRSITRWMVDKGARNIVLLSRSGKVEGNVRLLVDDLRENFGANVVVKACDVADDENVKKVVEECSTELPPIRGVIHSGMVLRVSVS